MREEDKEILIAVRATFWLTVITIVWLSCPSNLIVGVAAIYCYGHIYNKLRKTRILQFLLN